VGLPVKQKAGTFTYGDYLTWSDDERWELLNGVAFNMTPAPSDAHQSVVVQLVLQIGNHLAGKPCVLRCAPYDVRLPVGDETDDDIETVVQPDIVVICDEAKLDARGCRGAPDFVIEVLSPSTTHRDLFEKADAYERHGVKEYWVIHPVERVVYIRRLGKNGKFAPVQLQPGEGIVPVSVLKGLEIDLDAVFGAP